jgi:PAS domain S-box-containing protein
VARRDAGEAGREAAGPAQAAGLPAADPPAAAPLRERESQFRLFVEQAPAALAMFDTGMRYLAVSRRYLEDFGIGTPDDPQAMAGRSHYDLFPEMPAHWRALHRRVLAGESLSHEGEPFLRADGRTDWVRWEMTPWRHPDGAIGGALLFTEVITTRRDAETALRLDNDRLEARVAERSKALAFAAAELRAEMRRREETQAALLQAQKLEALGQLTGGVAHDFNNVLAAVIGSLKLIARRSADRPQILELARAGEQAADRATALVRQLLAFARREELAPAPIDLAALLAGTEAMVRRAAGAGIRLVIAVPPDLWPAMADAHRLEVALLNLAMNARDALLGGGAITIAARNAPGGRGPRAEPDRPPALPPLGDFVVVTVRDDGPGMAPEVLARATEPFFTTKPRGKGTGLGLAMVHGFAHQSGGALRLLSAPGEGTTVEVWLPRAAAEPTHADPAETTDADPARHGNASLLVVDDDDHVRLVTATQLRDLGYEVLEANGADAAMVQALAAEKLDLLVSDVVMPGGGGTELAARLRAARPGVPVLFITGFTDRQALDGEAVLAKPFTPRQLGEAVLAGLGRQPARNGLLARLRQEELREAYLVWRRLRDEAGGSLPRPDCPALARLAILPNAFAVVVEPGVAEQPTLRFILVGPALAARLGEPLEGRVLGRDVEADEAFAGLLDAYRRCVRSGTPCHDYARYALGEGAAPLLFERLLLPLSETGGRLPSHLLGLAFISGAV